jgi:hypothetical protein
MSTEAEWRECMAIQGSDTVRVVVSKRVRGHSREREVVREASPTETVQNEPSADTPAVKIDIKTMAKAFRDVRKELKESGKFASKEFKEMSCDLKECHKELFQAEKKVRLEAKKFKVGKVMGEKVLDFMCPLDVEALTLAFGAEGLEALRTGGDVPVVMARVVSVHNGSASVDSAQLGTVCGDMGMTALSAHEYERASALYAQAVRYLPRDLITMYNYACALSLCGRITEALHALHQAVHLGYRKSRHMAQDPDLAALRHTDEFKSLLLSLQPPTPAADMTNMFPPVIIPRLVIPAELTPVVAPVPTPAPEPAPRAVSTECATLLAVFPSLDEDTANALLVAHKGNVGKAIESLLS